MSLLIEQLLARVWNRLAAGRSRVHAAEGLELGGEMVDGQETSARVFLPHGKRAEHVVISGKTGSGKSAFLRHLAGQDIRSRCGFVFFDLHGDATPMLLRLIAEEERHSGADLSERLIVIEPADLERSVGLNVLEQHKDQHSFVQIAEFAQILKQRWHLDSFGARTEELLRNSLHVVSDNGLTLLELAPLLTNFAFRSACLRRAQNPDIREYFASRFDRASEAMQATCTSPILNKVSAFTSDPHFRHILGQQKSTFSLTAAMDTGAWLLFNLDKGRLGEQAATLGSLFITKLKNALFSRRSRSLFTLYCDEIQNLVTFDSGLETLFSEARKFGISIVSANQFAEQVPMQMRAAMAAVGSHVYFQLSSSDADKVASTLDGGRPLAELLKNLPQRHMVVKIGHQRWRRAVVPRLKTPSGDFSDLLRRSRERWARPRSDIEAEISQRQRSFRLRNDEVLHDWE